MTSTSGVVDSPVAEPVASRPQTMNASVGLSLGGCPNCGRTWGTGRSCQFCRQVDGLPLGVTLASPFKRLGAHLLDAVLVACTLFIGYFIWMLIAYGRGQTPAKQLLGMRYVTLSSGTASGWGRTFTREALAKPIVALLGSMTFGIVYFWLVWDRDNQELWDKLAGTVVVNDPTRQLA